MTGPGDQQNQPNDAWWVQEQPPAHQPYSQSDPTMIGQPGQVVPQQPAAGEQQPADPTVLRQSFDQPGAAPGGYPSAPGYPQPAPQSAPGYPQAGAQSSPAYPQAAPQSAPGYPQAGAQSSPAYPQAGAQSSPAYPQAAPQSAPGYPQAGAQSSPAYPQAAMPSTPAYPQAAQQSSPGYPQPAPEFQQSGFQSPAPGFAPPAPGYQQPAPGLSQPAPGFSGAGFQQPAPGFQQPGPGYQQPTPPRSGGKGWLWALGAVVLTSAVWAGAMFAIGAFDSGKADISKDADLRGYKYVDNLCDITDTTPYTSAGFTISKADSSGKTYPQHDGRKHPAVDEMGCDVRFTPSGSTEKYDFASIYTSATLHKQTNPGPEFTATYETWPQTEYGKDARVEKISGLGDEAYLITGKQKSDDPTADVSLAVRDGWTTYHISWSQYVSSSSKSSSKILSASDAGDKLKKTATSTLSKLRK